MKRDNHKTTFSLTEKNKAYLSGMGYLNRQTGHVRQNRRNNKKQGPSLNDFLNDCISLAIEKGLRKGSEQIPIVLLRRQRFEYERAKLQIQQLLLEREAHRIAVGLKALSEVNNGEYWDELHTMETVWSVRDVE